MNVQVNTMLSGLESAQLDTWLASHWRDEVEAVEIDPRCVSVRGRDLRLAPNATATATRQFGLLTAALNEALDRLRSEGGDS
ncbi:MAG: hypothetical protein ACXVH5_00270 [Ilumatobacteraceae bacterium]